MIPLFVWLAQKPKCFNVFKKYVAENPKLFQDTSDLSEDFDSPVCLACTTVKTLQYLPLQKAYFPLIWCFWRFLIIALIWHKKTMLLKGWSHGFFWHTRTPIIWLRPLICRPLNSMEDFSNIWVKSGKIHFYYSSVTVHLSLFIRYCLLVTIHDTVHSEFCLFNGGCLLCFSQVFLVVLLRELTLRTILLLVSLSLREFLVSYYFPTTLTIL